ncbi:hypothetical protein QBC39DRAFT_84657 [Podospora conica]|nr:hypothetical protein QBC39DRAFT_84657 [Schizothecium conicum]
MSHSTNNGSLRCVSSRAPPPPSIRPPCMSGMSGPPPHTLIITASMGGDQHQCALAGVLPGTGFDTNSTLMGWQDGYSTDITLLSCVCVLPDGRPLLLPFFFFWLFTPRSKQALTHRAPIPVVGHGRLQLARSPLPARGVSRTSNGATESTPRSASERGGSAEPPASAPPCPFDSLSACLFFFFFASPRASPPARPHAAPNAGCRDTVWERARKSDSAESPILGGGQGRSRQRPSYPSEWGPDPERAPGAQPTHPSTAAKYLGGMAHLFWKRTHTRTLPAPPAEKYAHVASPTGRPPACVLCTMQA